MEQTVDAHVPVFLHFGPLSEDLVTLANQKKVTIIDRASYTETANDGSFFESKYCGSIALLIAQHVPILISEAEGLVAKKGGLTLPYHVKTRAAGTPCNYFLLVSELAVDPDPKTDAGKLYGAVPKHLTLKQFSEYDLSTFAVPKVDMSQIKVTCGYLTTHVQDGVKVTGHMTRSFGKTFDESLLIKENDSHNLQKTFKGEIIGLTTSGKPGGSVIMVSDLGKTAHVTNNTSIKSVLSGPVVEKYQNGIMEFNLQDIDEKSKQATPIKIEKIGETEVLITGWYTYAIGT